MEIRNAVVEDYEAYARLAPELDVGEETPPRERFREDLVHRTVVAVDDSVVVGYALYELMGEVGYVRNIVSDPARRRAGIGRALMEAMRTRFLRASATSWCLNVKPGNTAAIVLYERCGLRVAYRSSVLRLPREVALPSPPTELALVPVTADEDDVVERTLHLLRGQLASARATPGRVTLQLRRGTDVVGVAVFAESIPGAFPFRVVEPALGAALLARLRARVPADATFLQVGIEDDDALAAALRALGAYVHLEILHMRGPLAPPAA